MIPTVRVEPCGCTLTIGPGHIHTKLCEQHKREAFNHHGQARPNNLDLVGG